MYYDTEFYPILPSTVNVNSKTANCYFHLGSFVNRFRLHSQILNLLRELVSLLDETLIGEMRRDDRRLLIKLAYGILWKICIRELTFKLISGDQNDEATTHL